jgi:periplasmic protein TonB
MTSPSLSLAQPDDGWLPGRGLAVSAALHGAAIAAVLAWSIGDKPAPPSPPVVELIRAVPEPLEPPEPPKPLTQPEPDAKPKQLTAARPVAQPLPQPKTTAASADQAETYTPPAAPTAAPPPGPVAPPAPAPAQPAPAAAPSAPPAPRQIATDGIPTDYVNQVYARINGNADYPREAKLKRQQGKVSYRLTLSPQGALLNVEIGSCGVEALDEAAREAIRRAAPFPKLPDLGGSSYLLAGNIVFQIR